MRTSSSRQLVGVDTVCSKAGRPPTVKPGVALGIKASNAWPTGLTGTVAPTLGQSAPGQTSLKLPVRSASEGTLIGEMVAGFFSFRHSSEKKKKVFFLSAL